VLGFRAIRRHYDRVARALAVPDDFRFSQHRHTVVVLLGSVNRGVLHGLEYAHSLRPDRIVAATVVHDDEQEDAILEAWERHELPMPLRVLHSPYRDLTGSVLRLLDELDDEWPDDIVSVVVPDFVLDHWWEQALHNQSALVLRARLRDRPNTAIISIPTHLDSGRPTSEPGPEPGAEVDAPRADDPDPPAGGPGPIPAIQARPQASPSA
jgi:hypothetical protein